MLRTTDILRPNNVTGVPYFIVNLIGFVGIGTVKVVSWVAPSLPAVFVLEA